MNNRILISCGLVVAMLMVIARFHIGSAQAGTEPQQQKNQEQVRQEVRQQVDKEFAEMEMPMFTGSTWQQAPQDDKIAFVWGICHVVTIEKALMETLPSLRVENFSAKVSRGLAGMKINDIVGSVDAYYAANPSKLEVPVIQVIWDTLVKPKLKTNIGGYPLE